MWNLETIGIKDERFTHIEKTTVAKVTSELKKTDAGYQVKLPFRSDDRPSVNYHTSYAQLNSLVAKFEKDVTLFEQYSKVIQDYLDRGFVEKVDLDDKSGCVLPHHPMFKERATMPLRV